ncbi:MAG: trimeric intracellular cation channel family protein [Clostridia bacterium]|nr:trimeric intracellular cation channel family protein [Clostridia bacterium]
MVDIILSIVEYIGVISFAISGAVIAIKKKADAVGAVFFALITCFGGGMIRDFALGVVPRILTVTSNYYLALVCILVSIICFALAFIPKTASFITKHSHNFAIEFTDAIGLSVFCVFGVDVAIELGYSNPILLIFCGCITGVGGGMLRDICSAEIPFIFRKHIYLIPTLCGAIFYTLTYKHIHHLASLLIAIGIIIVLRVLAIKFKWNLPVPRGEGEGIKDTVVDNEDKEAEALTSDTECRV